MGGRFVVDPRAADEKIELSLARIISALLDVVNLQHETNAELAQQVEELFVRVARLEHHR